MSSIVIVLDNSLNSPENNSPESKQCVGGIMIFNDYWWGGPNLTQKGIDSFLAGYRKRIVVSGPPLEKNSQVFIKKKY